MTIESATRTQWGLDTYDLGADAVRKAHSDLPGGTECGPQEGKTDGSHALHSNRNSSLALHGLQSPLS